MVGSVRYGILCVLGVRFQLCHIVKGGPRGPFQGDLGSIWGQGGQKHTFITGGQWWPVVASGGQWWPVVASGGQCRVMCLYGILRVLGARFQVFPLCENGLWGPSGPIQEWNGVLWDTRTPLQVASGGQ